MRTPALGRSGSALGSRTVGEVRLVALRETPLSLDEAHAAVSDASAGAVVLFVGAVRDHDEGHGVQALDYSAHPTAATALQQVAERAAKQSGVIGVAAVHRVGDLNVGDLAVIVAVSSAHRAEAFSAARWFIDELKATVPIWKHQLFDDGSQSWVGSP